MKWWNRFWELSGREVRNFFSLPESPGTGRYTIHGMITGLVTLFTLAIVFSPVLAMPGLTGVFIAMSARDMPPLRRLRILVVFGVCFVASQALGVAISGNIMLMVVVMALMGCLGSIVYHSLITFPPGAMQYVIACAVATYLPTRGVDGVTLVTAGACGFVLALCISMGLQLVDRNKAMRDDITAAEDAVEAMREEILTHTEAARRRVAAHAAVFTALEDVRLGYGWGRQLKPFSAFGRYAEKKTRDIHTQFVEAVVWRRWHTLRRMKYRVNADHAPKLSRVSPHLGPPSALRRVKWSLSFRSAAVQIGLRMGMSIFLTGALTYGLGFGHPYWAVMTSAMVLSLGKDRISTTHRGFDRVVGTLVGIALFGVIHVIDPPTVPLLLICALLYSTTLFTIGRNYALGSAWITAMILLILNTAPTNNLTATQIVSQRAGETIIGAIVALFVLWVTGSSRAPTSIVRRQARRVLLADGFLLDYVAERTDLTRPGIVARRQVLLELSASRRMEELYARDLPKGLAEWEDLSALINEFSYVVLCGCWVENPDEVIDARRARRALNEMIRRLPAIDGVPLDTRNASDLMKRVLVAARPTSLRQ